MNIIKKMKKSAIAMVALLLIIGILPTQAQETEVSLNRVTLAEATLTDGIIDATPVEVEFTEEEIAIIEEEQSDFVEALKEVDFERLSEKQLDETVLKLMKENYSSASEVAEEQVDFDELQGEQISVVTNMEDNVVSLSDTVDIIFEDAFVIINILEVGDEEFSDETEMGDETESNMTLASYTKDFFATPSVSAASKKKTASNTAHLYSWISTSIKVVTCFIEAEFTYTGSKVTARRTAHFMRANGIHGSVVSISGTSSAVQTPNDQRRIAYQQGTAKVGLQIKGIGLVFKTTYMRVNVECDAKGNISKYKTIR